MDLQTLLNNLGSWCMNVGLKVLIAVVIMIVSFAVINALFKKLQKHLEKKEKLDKTLTKALLYIGKIAAKILVTVCLVGYLGIDTSGITALIASLGVAVGLAVNGTLSNLAGGIMLLITRPFRGDDYIEACGYSGTVIDIRITYTKIRTIDNKVIYIPNGTLSTSTIVNYSEEKNRRVDLTFSISYTADFEKAENLILEICRTHPLVLKEPDPTVRIVSHSASSIDLVSRCWVKSSDYWTVYFDMLEAVKRTFDKNGVEIPYQQVDVHVKNG